jgi:hypothetical protein
MLNLIVDEGYAYDFLSILHVKVIKKICDENLYKKYFSQIELQVGVHLHKLITNSKEYKDCIQINEDIFNMVDLAKSDQVSASTVHNLNYKRYNAKITLQKTWFPSSQTTEAKN